MQKENILYDGLDATSDADKSSASAASPMHFSHSNPFLFPTSPTYVNSVPSFYSSFFQNYSSDSPSDTASFDGGDTDRRLHDASCVLEYQQLYNRYRLCLGQLHDSIEELTPSVAKTSLFASPMRISRTAPSAAAYPTATQPLTEHNRVERRSAERIPIPKSISVRSSGYLKMTQPSRNATGHKAVSQPAAALQRVCIPGSKKEEEALEFDAYNQGMFKTELCNKWEETGACPYGKNCQYAHGIKELRPVIRHPRYKTEVCRMVLAGDICPYGHRCHFRHSLTEQERLMAASSPR
ncbi:Zinc finger CCCH domain-containing protein 14 [Sesamum alatum]|uniref:Zinc finger CCCH domain-containing protein 14 n=1 Tax=Sesamum alatum TaxID=300844 RepID=A0AAE1YAN1_9LAMI|nr:Zinc finger CCCH domain-containing protein 14 [Sesamum alatum]